MHERLPRGRHAGALESPAELLARVRAVLEQRAADQLHAALGLRRRDALLEEPARVGRGQRRRREGVKPRVVLARDQVQGAAVQPCDQQAAIDRQRAVDVARRGSLAAGADRQPRAARVLALHREQMPRGGERVARGRAGEQL